MSTAAAKKTEVEHEPGTAPEDKKVEVDISVLRALLDKVESLEKRVGPDPSAPARRAPRAAKPGYAWLRHMVPDGSYKLIKGNEDGTDLWFRGDDAESGEKEVPEALARKLCTFTFTDYDENGHANTRARFQRMNF